MKISRISELTTSRFSGLFGNPERISRSTYRVFLLGILSLTVFFTACASTEKRDPNDPTSGVGSPIHSLILMREGSQFLQQQRFPEALKKFQEADEIAPGNATVHNMMGLCYLNLSQYSEALQEFNKALALIPNFTDAKNNRGLAYMSMGQYRMAEMDFTSVLSDTTYPHHWAVYYNLGLSYFKRGMTTAAEENFRKAITAPRPVYDAYLQMATIKAGMGETESAIDLLEEAKLKFPQRVEAQLMLGRLLVGLGRTDEAKPYLEEVIRAGPSSKLAKEAEVLLEEVH